MVLERTGDKLASSRQLADRAGRRASPARWSPRATSPSPAPARATTTPWSYALRGKRDDRKNTVLKGAATQTGTPSGTRACTMTLFKLRKTGAGDCGVGRQCPAAPFCANIDGADRERPAPAGV